MGGNMQRLGNMLSSRMSKSARAAVPTVMELGVVNKNLSISVDGIKTPIPRGAYMLSTGLSSALSKGDRVLVAWVGHEPVVVAIVVSS